jgi:iron(III) transport system substrate-binding protein
MRPLGALAALALLVVTLAGCGGGGGSSLVVYNGQHAQLTQALVSAFERQTGIRVAMRSGDSLVLATQILTEGRNSPADVVLAENSPELVTLSQHRLLGQLPQSILGQIQRDARSPSGDWIGMALRISSLIYDPRRLPRAQLPKSILDLAQPRWKGRVSISPTDSDFPPLVSAVLAAHGEQATLAWLRGLKRNAVLHQDEEAVVAAVNRGDVASGIVNQYYWYRLRLETGAKGMHSTLYYFPEADVGSVANVAGTAVLATSKHRAAALRFVRFLVGERGQRILARSDDFEYPSRAGVAANPALPPLAEVPHVSADVSELGNGQEAARLIRRAGLV